MGAYFCGMECERLVQTVLNMTTVPTATLIYISACNHEPCSLRQFHVPEKCCTTVFAKTMTTFFAGWFRRKPQTCSHPQMTRFELNVQCKRFRSINALDFGELMETHLQMTRPMHSIKNKWIRLFNCIIACHLLTSAQLIPSEFQPCTDDNCSLGFIKCHRSLARLPLHLHFLSTAF